MNWFGELVRELSCQWALNWMTLWVLRDESRPDSGNGTDREEATGVKLGRPWPWLGPNKSPLGRNLCRTRASWLQPRPNLSPGVQRFERQPQCGQHGLARNSSKKTLGVALKRQVFSLSHWVRKTCSGLGRAAPKRPNLRPNCTILDRLGDRTETQVGANWSCLVEVGRKALQMDLKKKQGMEVQVQSGATWDPLATASHQVGPNGHTTWGTLLQTKRHQQQRNVEQHTSENGHEDFASGRLVSRSWSQWVQVGPKLGPRWSKNDPKWSPCCGHVGSKRCIGRCCADMQSYHSPVHVFAACPGRTWVLPQLKLHRWKEDCSNRLAPS